MGVAEDIELFEKSLNELIIKYEHYFLGLERREPLKLLDNVERLSRKYLAQNITNTMSTFRYNSLKSRLTSYKQYWSRITRLMEEGKYSRDRFKMEYHQKTAAPPHPPAARDNEDKQMESLYNEFVKARRECNLSVEGMTKEAMVKMFEKHKRAAQEKYACAEVELTITIDKGNPRLKIRPKS